MNEQENQPKIFSVLSEKLITALISGFLTFFLVLFSPIRDNIWFWAYDVWPSAVPAQVKIEKGNKARGYFDYNNVTVNILDQNKQPAKKTDGEGIVRFDRVYTGLRRFALSQDSFGGWSTIKEFNVQPTRKESEIDFRIKTFNIEGYLWRPSQENSKQSTQSNTKRNMLKGLTVLIEEKKELRTKVRHTGKFSIKNVPAFQINPNGKFSIKNVPAFQINPNGKLILIMSHSDCTGPLKKRNINVNEDELIYQVAPLYNTPKDLIEDIKACRFAHKDNQGKETVLPSRKEHLLKAEQKYLDDKTGFTPLMLAAYKNKVKKVKSILDSEKDINLEAKSKNGLNALAIAAAKGHLEIVSKLFKRGALIDTRDSWTYSPFLWACNEGHASVVEFLLANGANPDDEESLHNSALMRACVRGHEDVVKILLIAGANPNSKNVLGFSPLIEAVGHPKPEICALLIGYGANISATDYGTHGCKTALMWAAQLGRKEIVKVLLNLGADVSLSTCKAVGDQPAGMTALDFAENQGHFQIAQRLRNHMENK